MHQSTTDMQRIAAISSDVEARAALLTAATAIEQKDAALREACDQLEGWIRWKCSKKHLAEHLTHLEQLRSVLTDKSIDGQDCPVCDGTGEIAQLLPGSRHFTDVQCDVCKGDGCISSAPDLAGVAERAAAAGSESAALALQCSDFATSLRSAYTVAALKGEAPASFRRAAELLERAAIALNTQAR